MPAALTGMVALAAMAGVPAASAVDRGTFELDGNAVDDAGLAGDDWSSALTGGGSADLLQHTGVVPDPLNTTIFTGGGSKDDLAISGWQHTNGAVPDKNEITNAYAAAYNKAGDLVVYFGADRYATNGNSNLGFWFLQQDVAPVDGGSFSGEHQPGDILVLSEFTNGGSQPTIQVYEWRPGAPDAINGTLRLLTNSNSVCNATQTGTTDPVACAIVNSAPAASPWAYQPKSGAADTFAKGAFFEGGINVSDLFAAQGQTAPCITSFIAETRSSQSVDATLKDFVAGDFNLCSASMQIAGSGVNEVGDQHTFTATVTKTVAGVTSGVAGVTPAVTLSPAPSGPQPVDNGTCDEGTDTSGQCTVIFNSDTAGIITGSATATFTEGGQTFNVATGTAAATGAAVKRYVDAKIGINPPLDTNGITEQHTFTVDVQQDDGFPAGAAGGDAVTGFGPVPNGITPVVTLTPGTTDAVVTGKTDSCASPGTVNGSCTVVFTSNSAGTVTGSASVSLAFAGLTGTVERSTDAVGANSGTAVKHFVEGTLSWLKHDQDGSLLGGATFEVCRTTSYDSHSRTHTSITPVCLSVTDNDARDVDTVAGQLELEGLVMGTYTVKETAAPAGYSFDPTDVKTALVETLPTDGVPGSGPNQSITVAFVNTQLYKMIVLTCNQVTNELVVSTVTVNGASKDTLGTPPGASDLCSLGGASFGDLRAGTYAPSVVIPKAATP